MDTMEDTAQFLMQATLGADYDTIQSTASTGISTWLDQQLNNTHDVADSFQTKTQDIWNSFRADLITEHGAAVPKDGDAALPYWYYMRLAWWQRTLNKGRNAASSDKELDDKDLVRHRVAQALSEIMVISDNSSLQLDAVGMASFYDIFYRNAFGSFQDILREVSLHPCMGVYLSHMNNRKEDPANNIHPDENYAREIMQLFSIGLFELNADGSRKKDADGKDIPTYNNADIKQLARVFTGIKAASYDYEWTGLPELESNGTPITFADGVSKTYKTVPYVDMVTPMTFDETFHDQGAKSLLNGRINIPAGQTSLHDVQNVVDALVAHPNTGPFIAERLIQQLVTSNPSPQYVQAVAATFGSTGDMKAVVRGILLHAEAKTPKKLKSPVLRTTQLLRVFNANNTSGKLWILGNAMKDQLNQHVLSSPTVFNFYQPDYTPHGAIESADQVAPEFTLHNAATSIAYVNLMYDWFFGDAYPAVSTVVSSTRNNLLELDWDALTNRADYNQDKLTLDFSEEENLASQGNYDELIDRVCLLLTGKTQHPNRQDIKDAFSTFQSNDQWVVQTVVFMIAISPEFTVLGGAQ